MVAVGVQAPLPLAGRARLPCVDAPHQRDALRAAGAATHRGEGDAGVHSPSAPGVSGLPRSRSACAGNKPATCAWAMHSTQIATPCPDSMSVCERGPTHASQPQPWQWVLVDPVYGSWSGPTAAPPPESCRAEPGRPIRASVSSRLPHPAHGSRCAATADGAWTRVADRATNRQFCLPLGPSRFVRSVVAVRAPLFIASLAQIARPVQGAAKTLLPLRRLEVLGVRHSLEDDDPGLPRRLLLRILGLGLLRPKAAVLVALLARAEPGRAAGQLGLKRPSAAADRCHVAGPSLPAAGRRAGSQPERLHDPVRLGHRAPPLHLPDALPPMLRSRRRRQLDDRPPHLLHGGGMSGLSLFEAAFGFLGHSRDTLST